MKPTPHACPPMEPTASPAITLYSTRLAATASACRAWMCAFVALCVVLAAVLVWTQGVYQASLRRQPLVVGYEPGTGATRILNPDSLKFRPTDDSLRHFLLHFVREHLERTHTVDQDYGHSLLYMDRRLSTSLIDQDVRQIKAWQSAHGDEIRVKVLNVTLEDTRQGCQDGIPPHPCRAKIDYQKSFYSRDTEHPTAVKAFAADLVFVLKSEITNDMIEDNPLGLIITDFHEYEGFP